MLSQFTSREVYQKFSKWNSSKRKPLTLLTAQHDCVAHSVKKKTRNFSKHSPSYWSSLKKKYAFLSLCKGLCERWGSVPTSHTYTLRLFVFLWGTPGYPFKLNMQEKSKFAALKKFLVSSHVRFSPVVQLAPSKYYHRHRVVLCRLSFSFFFFFFLASLTVLSHFQDKRLSTAVQSEMLKCKMR